MSRQVMIRVDENDLDYSDEQVCLYEGKPFTGIAYENIGEVPISEVMYENGARNGITKIWYPSGILALEEQFRSDTRHGSSVEWYENGGLKNKAHYEYGILVDKTEWNAIGEITKQYSLLPSDPGYELLVLRRSASRENGE